MSDGLYNVLNACHAFLDVEVGLPAACSGVCNGRALRIDWKIWRDLAFSQWGCGFRFISWT